MLVTITKSDKLECKFVKRKQQNSQPGKGSTMIEFIKIIARYVELRLPTIRMFMRMRDH